MQNHTPRERAESFLLLFREPYLWPFPFVGRRRYVAESFNRLSINPLAKKNKKTSTATIIITLILDCSCYPDMQGYNLLWWVLRAFFSRRLAGITDSALAFILERVQLIWISLLFVVEERALIYRLQFTLWLWYLIKQAFISSSSFTRLKTVWLKIVELVFILFSRFQFIIF